MKVKVISLPYIFQVLYVLCFTRPRYQVSVYRTIGPLVNFLEVHFLTTYQKALYLDHRYPVGLAFNPSHQTPGSLPGGGAGGQNLVHPENVVKFSYQDSFLYLDHRYIGGLTFIL